MNLYSTSYLSRLVFTALFAGSISVAAGANPLKTILQQNLTAAPEVREAKANIEAAQNRTEQSKSQHYPIVDLTASKTLSQHHRYNDDYSSKKIVPGAKAEINIFAFGAIEKDIERSTKEEQYYQHTYDATREELAYTIGKLYLTALNMKESIAVMQKSLARHQNIIADLTVIADNDEGRESELVQAETRMLMVQQEINSYRQRLATTLNTLSKYTKKKVTEKDLSNPFHQLTSDQLYHRYTLERKEQNPLYRATVAEFEAKNLSVEAEEKKRLPRINLVGSANRDDRQLGVEVAWNAFNRGSDYSVREKASEIAASQARMLRTERDIEESASLAKINIEESQSQLKTLKKQISASEQVIEFYRLQFDVARRSLLDVLNAEKELSTVELAYATTQSNLRMAMLDYLYTQGMISTWSGVAGKEVRVNFK